MSEEVAVAKFSIVGAEEWDRVQFSLKLMDTTQEELWDFSADILAKVVSGRIDRVTFKGQTTGFQYVRPSSSSRSYVRWLIKHRSLYGEGVSLVIPFANLSVVLPYRSHGYYGNVIADGPMADLIKFLEAKVVNTIDDIWRPIDVIDVSVSTKFLSSYLRKKEQYETAQRSKD